MLGTSVLMYSGNFANARAASGGPVRRGHLGPRLNLYPFCLSLLFAPSPAGLPALRSSTHLSPGLIDYTLGAKNYDPRHLAMSAFTLMLFLPELHFL